MVSAILWPLNFKNRVAGSGTPYKENTEEYSTDETFLTLEPEGPQYCFTYLLTCK